VIASVSASNITAWSYGQLGPIIAQLVICAYLISNISAPAPRYFYYTLLTLIFVFSQCIWATKVFLGAAAAYAATAAVDIFILISNETPLSSMQKVTLPFSTIISLELDLDAVTVIVVSRLRTGLLLQTW
jgi:hypothetical protein